MENFKKLLFLLSSQERNRAVLLLLMILIMAFLEMIGVASILPFMAVLTNPNIVKTNLVLEKMFNLSIFFGVQNEQQFLFVLGVLVFMILITSLSFEVSHLKLNIFVFFVTEFNFFLFLPQIITLLFFDSEIASSLPIPLLAPVIKILSIFFG